MSFFSLENRRLWLVNDRVKGGAHEVDSVDLEVAKKAGVGVFFTVNPVGDLRNEKGNLRHEANMLYPAACFVDFDSGIKDEQWEKIKTLPLLPSYVVESGRGFHVYWKLRDTKREDFSLWSRIQTAIAATLGGDRACKDPARLMRWPGSWHVKGEPMLVRVVVDEEHDYRIDDIEIAFPPKVETVVRVSETFHKPIRSIPLTTLYPGDRHATLVKVAARYFAHTTRSEIEARRAELKAWYVQSCVSLKDGWEKEVDEVVQWFITHEYA